MTSRNLGEFLQKLESAGELVRIGVPVSRDLEITEIVDRVCKGPAAGNTALLFENVVGATMPVAVIPSVPIATMLDSACGVKCAFQTVAWRVCTLSRLPNWAVPPPLTAQRRPLLRRYQRACGLVALSVSAAHS